MKREPKKPLKLTREIVRVLDDTGLQDARGGNAVGVGGGGGAGTTSRPPPSTLGGCVVGN